MSTGLLNRFLSRSYGLATTAALPIVALALLSASRGRRRFKERFGLWEGVPRVNWWLHGASVGEVQGLTPFIREVKGEQGTARVLLTATSPTGLDKGRALVDEVRLLPLDSPVTVNQALKRASFDRFVLSETELWPSLLEALHQVNAPVHIINGRISDYTFSWYSRLRGVFAPLLNKSSSISVPDNEQFERFLSLGINPKLLHLTGHTKYDIAPRYVSNGNDNAARAGARQRFFSGIGDTVRVLTLGSIREGEERFWFPALKRAWDTGVNLRVIVAPRHAERFEYFNSEAIKAGFQVARWSLSGDSERNQSSFLLLDTMGLLEEAYAASDLAFVGATLVDIGGHNPLEPAMYRVPIVVGPYTSVIREPVSRLREQGGIIELRSEAEIFTLISEFALNIERFQSIGHSGYKVYLSYQGAAKRALDVIRSSEIASNDRVDR